MSLDEIRKLSVSERIRLVEDIWDTIAESPDSLPVTEAQKQELDRRIAEHKAHPDHGMTWEEVRKSLNPRP